LATADEILPERIEQPQAFTWVVGNAVEQAFEPLVNRLNAVENLTIKLAALNSDYWGQEITVTGLLTGQDLIDKLSGQEFGYGILLPTVMLKHDEAKFLDDMTVPEVAIALRTPIYPIENITALMERCLNQG
jgi:NifB/MoaA-like Fe-S oxidoreductase